MKYIWPKTERKPGRPKGVPLEEFLKRDGEERFQGVEKSVAINYTWTGPM